jgi:AcrR family transcriptional regulator
MTSIRHTPSRGSAHGQATDWVDDLVGDLGTPPGHVPEDPPGTDAVILAAARALVLDVGFRRATIADVARRAGVSRMTVYREFDDLAAIWSRLLTDELVSLITQSAADLAELPTARARIVGMATALVEEIPAHPLFRRALDVDPELLLPLVVDRFGSSQRAVLARLAPMLVAGQADGSVRQDLTPPAAAATILLAAQSFVFSTRAIDTLPDPSAARRELPALLDRYLAP